MCTVSSAWRSSAVIRAFAGRSNRRVWTSGSTAGRSTRRLVGTFTIFPHAGPGEPKALSDALLAEIDRWRGGAAADDDQTVIVMHHNASDAPHMTLRQATKSLAKMFGLIRM